MYPAEALAVGGKVEVDAVIYAGIRRCEGDAGPGGVDLADEGHCGGVGLEPLNYAAPVLLLDVPVYGHGLHPGLAQDLLAKGLYFVYLRQEAGENHQLLLALHNVVLEYVGQGVQLSPAYQLGPGGVILYQEAAGELLKAEQLREDRGGGDPAAVGQFCVAVPAEAVVEVPLFLAEGDVPVFKGLFRQVQGFLFGHPVGDTMLLLYQLIQVPVADNLLAVEAAHFAVATPEGVEVRPKNRGVEEAVLAEYVDCLVLYRGTGEDHLVSGLVPQVVKGLALFGVVGLDPLAFVCDYQIGVVFLQGVEDALPPGAFVVDDRHLQVVVGEAHQVRQLLQALGLAAQHGLDGVGEGGVLLEFFGPDGADRGGGYDQHPLYLAHLVPSPGHRYGGEGLAATHLKQEAEAFPGSGADFSLGHGCFLLPLGACIGTG